MIGNSLRWELNAFVGFIERQKNLYRRYWLWEAVWLLYNLVSVLSIGYLAAGLSTLGLEKGQADLHQTQLYLLVGALLWTYLSLVFFEIAFAITWERWEGTIEYTFMAPIKRLTHLLGMSAASLIYGIAPRHARQADEAAVARPAAEDRHRPQLPDIALAPADG
jgi:ABC-2 type transport system permease protein